MMMNNANSSTSASSSPSAASSPYGYMPFSATSTPNAPASQMTSPGSAAAQAAIHIHGLRHEHLDHVGSGGGSPSAQLSAMHSSLRPSASPSGSSPSSINVSVSGIGSAPTAPASQHHHQHHHQHALGNGNGSSNNHPSNGLPPINTDMLTNFSSMLPSPQPSSQLSSSASAGSVLPTTPPQTADLDTILAMYAGQPELLKLIIASKTEEDRRWAEEARFKMMDLMMRENRGMPLMTGYEGLLAPTGTPTSGAGGTPGTDPGTAAGTPAISTTTAGPPASGVTTTVVGTSSVLLASLGMNSSNKRFMDDDDEGLDQQTPGTTGSGTGNGSRGSALVASGNGGSGQGDQAHPGLSRKRSVTFAREVHTPGHLRSQSMSSMPSGAGSSVQMSVLSMMPLNGSTQALASQPPPPPQSLDHPSQMQQHHGLPPPLQQHGNGLSMQQQYQQHQFQQQQQQQQQQQHQFQQQQPPHLSHHHMPPQPPQHQMHQQNQQLPPQFGQYPPMFSYHGTLPNLPSQQIRRTSSLSHLSQFAQNSHMVGSSEQQQQRLVAGRSRNFSASSHRTMDDSDDDESDDEDYDHPVMGLGNSSRPGSSLGMNNTMGGTGEVSITHEFSDMLSGPSGLGGGNGGGHHGHGHSHSHGGGPFGGASHHQMFQTHQQPSTYPHLSQQHQQQQQQQQHHQQYPASSPTSSSSSSASNSMAILSTLHAGLGTVVNSNVFNTGVVAPNVTLVRSSSAGGRTSSTAAAADSDPKKKRKRREMQPVNQIIETFEPHVDQYLWKNNGNTIQKKTKCKSIYYKCSNSGGGCTVNKTVTEKEGGGFITKYRGHHLPECINFKRAQLAVQAAQAAQNAYTLEKEQ